MSINLLKLVDPELKNDQLYEPILTKIKDKYKVFKNPNSKSFFKYYTDNYIYLGFMIKNCKLKDYTYYTFSLEGVVESSKNGYDIMYFINCEDGLYYWKFEESEIMLNYDFKGDNNMCFRFSIPSNKFKLYE
jgi:hypothetical protein